MLTILGHRQRSDCDGLSRRSFLRIGGARDRGRGVFIIRSVSGRGGPGNFRRPAQGGHQYFPRRRAPAPGSVGHQDRCATGNPWRIQADRPRTCRASRFAKSSRNLHLWPISWPFIRSVVGATDRHDGFQCMTGWLPNELQSIGGHPSLGAVVTKLQGPTDPAIPPFVGLAEKTKEIRWSDSGKPGFLGAGCAPSSPMVPVWPT